MAAPLPGPVAFDYPLWAASYPELASSVTPTTAEAYWGMAAIYLPNTAGSLVRDNAPGGQRAVLLNMLTAHIAKLNAPINGEAPSDLVGRISAASEGGVSVTAEMPGTTPNAAWFMQTKYGAQYWQATAQYRTMRYRAGPRPYLGVGPYGAGYQNGYGAF